MARRLMNLRITLRQLIVPMTTALLPTLKVRSRRRRLMTYQTLGLTKSQMPVTLVAVVL